MKILYESIIESITDLFLFYGELFGFAVEHIDIEAYFQKIGKKGINFFNVSVPKKENSACIYTHPEMKRMMQNYLEAHILPESEIQPYYAGHELIEALYINKMQETEDKYLFTIVYIDSNTAFRYVKNAKRFNF